MNYILVCLGETRFSSHLELGRTYLINLKVKKFGKKVYLFDFQEFIFLVNLFLIIIAKENIIFPKLGSNREKQACMRFTNIILLSGSRINLLKYILVYLPISYYSLYHPIEV